jgi:hypothetical protein
MISEIVVAAATSDLLVLFFFIGKISCISNDASTAKAQIKATKACRNPYLSDAAGFLICLYSV